MSDDLESAVLEGRAAHGSLGRPARYEARCGSTNDVALELADAGAPHGAMVVAGEQTAGRGRRGRVWHSPPTCSLSVSLVLRPEPQQGAPTLLVAAVGLGLAEGVERATGLSVGIKWPNDLWIGGRKVAGVLVEARGFDGARPVLVAGFGVNVGHAAADFPADLRPTATSLAVETGSPPPRGRLLSALIASLDPRLEQACGRAPAADLEARYRDRSVLLGRRVTLLEGDAPLVGTVADLSATEGLLLRTDVGSHVHVRAEHARDVRVAPVT